jgi:hypothetical protein
MVGQVQRLGVGGDQSGYLGIPVNCKRMQTLLRQCYTVTTEATSQVNDPLICGKTIGRVGSYNCSAGLLQALFGEKHASGRIWKFRDGLATKTSGFNQSCSLFS